MNKNNLFGFSKVNSNIANYGNVSCTVKKLSFKKTVDKNKPFLFLWMAMWLVSLTMIYF